MVTRTALLQFIFLALAFQTLDIFAQGEGPTTQYPKMVKSKTENSLLPNEKINSIRRANSTTEALPDFTVKDDSSIQKSSRPFLKRIPIPTRESTVVHTRINPLFTTSPRTLNEAGSSSNPSSPRSPKSPKSPRASTPRTPKSIISSLFAITEAQESIPEATLPPTDPKTVCKSPWDKNDPSKLALGSKEDISAFVNYLHSHSAIAYQELVKNIKRNQILGQMVIHQGSNQTFNINSDVNSLKLANLAIALSEVDPHFPSFVRRLLGLDNEVLLQNLKTTKIIDKKSIKEIENGLKILLNVFNLIQDKPYYNVAMAFNIALAINVLIDSNISKQLNAKAQDSLKVFEEMMNNYVLNNAKILREYLNFHVNKGNAVIPPIQMFNKDIEFNLQDNGIKLAYKKADPLSEENKSPSEFKSKYFNTAMLHYRILNEKQRAEFLQNTKDEALPILGVNQFRDGVSSMRERLKDSPTLKNLCAQKILLLTQDIATKKKKSDEKSQKLMDYRYSQNIRNKTDSDYISQARERESHNIIKDNIEDLIIDSDGSITFGNQSLVGNKDIEEIQSNIFYKGQIDILANLVADKMAETIYLLYLHQNQYLNSLGENLEKLIHASINHPVSVKTSETKKNEKPSPLVELLEESIRTMEKKQSRSAYE